MRNLIVVSALILFLGVGYAHAGCVIDSPKGTPVTLARSRADSFSVVGISWENEQMANGTEHLIKWHSTMPVNPGSFRYTLRYSFDNVNYSLIASNLTAESNDGTYEYGQFSWMPPAVNRSKKIFLQLVTKRLNGTVASSCTKKAYIVTEDPVSIAIESSRDGATWKRLSNKPVEKYTENTDTVPTGGTGNQCVATYSYRVLYLSGTGAILGLGTDSITIVNASDQVRKIAGSGSGYVTDYLGLRSNLTINIEEDGAVRATIIRQGQPATFSGDASAHCTGNEDEIAVFLSGYLQAPPGYVFLCNNKDSVYLTGDGYTYDPYGSVSGNMIDECNESNGFYWKKN